jgi:uncharacterized damage-inducible protein DinB
MTASTELLIDAFGRVHDIVHRVIKGLAADDLAARVDGEANSIAWLVWHLTRVQDDHISEVAESEQLWISEGWSDRFGLPFSPDETGYGQSSSDVGDVNGVSGELLTGYHDAVYERTVRFVEGLDDSDLARIVDTRWTPPVTLAVRLVSVISDDLQHAGQAAFVAGMLNRR